MAVEDAIKLVVSAGIVTPNSVPQKTNKKQIDNKKKVKKNG